MVDDTRAFDVIASVVGKYETAMAEMVTAWPE
jgi:hypothetical protein